MKLNNKGFAITTILYTLLILFSMILISIISGLNTRNKILDKSIENIENEYNWDCAIKTGDETKDDPAISKIELLNITEKKGKYIFKTSLDSTEECYTYLARGVNLRNTNELTFTTENCNNNKNSLILIGFCPEKE